mmetsp:Transcript_25309/g.82667  ORF Transcript_25309/g.82667 Transcript_25309/m.82667 type:complete len:283 (-) Transcript_25309:673-1521(-)
MPCWCAIRSLIVAALETHEPSQGGSRGSGSTECINYRKSAECEPASSRRRLPPRPEPHAHIPDLVVQRLHLGRRRHDRVVVWRAGREGGLRHRWHRLAEDSLVNAKPLERGHAQVTGHPLQRVRDAHRRVDVGGALVAETHQPRSVCVPLDGAAGREGGDAREQHRVAHAVRDVEAGSERPAHAVDQRDARVGEGDARLARAEQHRLPRRAVGRRAARGVKRTAEPPHRRGGDAVGEGVGLGRDVRLHRVADRVDAGVGGEPERLGESELVVEDRLFTAQWV